MLAKYLENVRAKHPLIHNITNYVTVNDCANILIACGASPIMADDTDEAAEITGVCAALNINIGTLNKATIPSMFSSGVRSNELGHPVLLDPVGAGASGLRTDTALKLVSSISLAVIRGNISEIKALAMGEGSTKGVDAAEADAITGDTLEAGIALARMYSKRTGAVVAITGATDIVANAEKAFVITNGVPIMSDITGSGCMLSALTTAFIAANPENTLEATAAAVCAMGLCGELAKGRMTKLDGNSSFRNYLIDAMYGLTGDALDKGAKYEVR